MRTSVAMETTAWCRVLGWRLVGGSLEGGRVEVALDGGRESATLSRLASWLAGWRAHWFTVCLSVREAASLPNARQN